MRRTKLIWMAAGLAISSAIWIVTEEFLSEKESVAFIVIKDRDYIEPSKMAGMSNEEIGVNMSSAGLARQCGATAFETKWQGSSHSVPETRVPVLHTNTKVIECIITRAPKEGFPLNIIFEIPDAQTH